jgi:hypothetical protein
VHLAHYLGLLDRAESDLAVAFRTVADGHGDEPDVAHQCRRLAGQCDAHDAAVQPFAARYGEDEPSEPDRLHAPPFVGTRSGGLGLLRDLHDLYVMACLCEMAWAVVGQAAQGARDGDLLSTVSSCEAETAAQVTWLRTRMKEAAPQALVVAS